MQVMLESHDLYMKEKLLILFSFLTIYSIGQKSNDSSTNNVIGTWEITKTLSVDGDAPLPPDIYLIIVKSDNTFENTPNGESSGVSQKRWKLENNTITFEWEYTGLVNKCSCNMTGTIDKNTMYGVTEDTCVKIKTGQKKNVSGTWKAVKK